MSKFFAFLNRMKYIKRWSLMRSIREENIMEHSQQVAVIAHALALIDNKMFDGKVDVSKVVLLAQYHEVGEVITGDLPTPIKYFNAQINTAYKELERLSAQKLLDTLPEELKEEYTKFVLCEENSEEYQIMKWADKISAYIKCVSEVKSGNSEFVKAKETVGKAIFESEEPCVKYFVEKVLPSFEKTLDELDM